MRIRSVTGCALLFAAVLPGSALAAWPNSPFTNLPVCTMPNSQDLVEAVSDGAGGAFVVWRDYRAGFPDIYAQHLLVSGTVDPAWPADGLAVCTAPSYEDSPEIISDGSGGAIVTWADFRSGNFDIYAQHVLGSGTVDPAWPVNGRALCTATQYQDGPQLVSDGAGGAIVAWTDFRSGSEYDLYAQHVQASGVVNPAWPTDGRLVCGATQSQYGPRLATDGAGGAIITWYDGRSGSYYDIYAQRVLSSGLVDPAWPFDGRAVCLAAFSQYEPQLVSDGAGGAIITWYDVRSGSHYDVYAHHVFASGITNPIWPVDGLAVCAVANSQQLARIATDGAGGAIIAWEDIRNGSHFNVYAQHVLPSGTADPAWPANGRQLASVAGQQVNARLEPDGAGGAIVAWIDARSFSSYDVYAQHVLATGAVDPAWPSTGRAVSTATGDQDAHAIVGDGAGSVIVAWRDLRTGSFYDAYAQRIGRYGYLGTPEAEIASVADVPNDQGGKVKLSWNASYLESEQYYLVTYYRVFRSVPPNLVASLREGGARVVRMSDPEAMGIERPGVLLETTFAATTYYWEYLATVNVDYLPNYSYLAATSADSTGAGNPTTAFMVQARTAGTQHWESAPMSGYSVDDLAPAAPAPFAGHFISGTTHLHWNPNTEADLAGYRLYRGTSAGFVPGVGNQIAAPPDTGYADAAGGAYWYKLTAVDVHGNESPVATLSPTGTVDVGGVAAPRELSFSAPKPNPASAETVLDYALPSAGQIRLAVYDAAGRLVRELVSGSREAGAHTEAWDLRNDAGRRVGAGLYFARLDVEGQRALTRRVAITH